MSEAVFGSDGKVHPVTGMSLESGIGALPHDRQAELHCDVIEQKHGKAAADSMREKVRAWIAKQAEPEPESLPQPEPEPEPEPLPASEEFKPGQEI